MPAIFVLIFIPIIFYLVIPGAGAFRVRNIWRHFRDKMIDSSFYPISGYEDIIALKKEGYYRFFGEIESIQSESLLWVRNKQITMSAKMKHCNIYMIPSEKKKSSQMPLKLSWNRVFSLAEGTAIYISGHVVVEKGKCLFSGTDKEALTIIIYDGVRDTLLSRSIICGRQKNEYWNFLTPWSVAIGGILSLLLLDLMIKASVSSTVLMVGILISSIPILPFIPPGLFFFYLYTLMWKKGRQCRSDRDLINLPLRFENRKEKDSNYFHVKFSNNKAFYPLTNGYIRRNIKDNFKKPSLWNNSVLGCLVEKEDGQWFTNPEDPMKEYVLFEDDPNLLILRSTQRALCYELMSLVSISISILVNTYVLIQLIKILM